MIFFMNFPLNFLISRRDLEIEVYLAQFYYKISSFSYSH